MAYDVGKMGREIFVPKTDGTIIPNSKLGGGDTYYDLEVANGVTPEQMHMYMQQTCIRYIRKSCVIHSLQ